jgi:hypothetical protein
MLGWVLGCTFIYSALFGTGSFLYEKTPQALVWLALFVVSGVGLTRVLPRLWSGSDDGDGEGTPPTPTPTADVVG